LFFIVFYIVKISVTVIDFLLSITRIYLFSIDEDDFIRIGYIPDALSKRPNDMMYLLWRLHTI